MHKQNEGRANINREKIKSGLADHEDHREDRVEQAGEDIAELIVGNLVINDKTVQDIRDCAKKAGMSSVELQVAVTKSFQKLIGVILADQHALKAQETYQYILFYCENFGLANVRIPEIRDRLMEAVVEVGSMVESSDNLDENHIWKSLLMEHMGGTSEEYEKSLGALVFRDLASGKSQQARIRCKGSSDVLVSLRELPLVARAGVLKALEGGETRNVKSIINFFPSQSEALAKMLKGDREVQQAANDAFKNEILTCIFDTWL